MNKFWVYIWSIFISLSVVAQQKLFTLEEAVSTAYRTMYAKNLYYLQWRNNETFTYVKGSNLYQQTIKSDKETILINGNQLVELTKDSAFNKVFMFPEYKWVDDNHCWILHRNYIVLVDVNKKQCLTKIILPDTAENIDVNFSKKIVAYTIGNNLWLQYDNGERFAISNDTTDGIVYGKSVHRNEFGIEKGTFWSNTGRYLAFYRMDETMVTQYPLVDISTRIATLKPIRYPMAGMKSHEVTVGIFDVLTKKIIYLKTGEPKEQYLTNISWSYNDEYVGIAVLNREQNHMKFNLYDVKTGNFVKTLFEEKNERYVEPLHPAIFINKSQFIWQSQRDGYNHLYLYDIEGNLIKQLTKGEWVVTQYLGYNAKSNNVYFLSTNPSPLERHLWKINLNTLKMTKITNVKGLHEIYANGDFTYFIDTYSNLSTPTTYDLINEKERVRTIVKADNIFVDYAMPTVEIITIKAADNKTDLYARIIKPHNFNKNQKYPLILYVYGGPHVQMVQNEWLAGASLWDFYMAQQGYIVATIDNRGSANRGFEFESCIHRQLGINEVQDQKKFVDHLIQQGYIDEKRIGVFGWSYGGFMTINLMTTYPEIFKVGVAGGPVIDWKYYEVMYGERYMDTPQENPEGYEKTSLINKAKNLKGKLEIIHGYIDDTVVLQHSLAFIEECIKLGIQVDYFIYPKHAHNVRGKDRIHLMNKVTTYFNDYLK